MKPQSISQEESDDEVLARHRLHREREVMVDFICPLRPAAETVQGRSSQVRTASTNNRRVYSALQVARRLGSL